MSDRAAERSWTVLELIRWTTDYFKQAGIDSARLDAEVLLAQVLDMGRLDLYLAFDQNVSVDDRGRFRELVRRRAGERVPVAYLTGVREFWSLPFAVGPGVLIPRPDTETLVRVAAELKPARVIEMGAGSACVAAALANELPDAVIVAVERSPEALDYARRNLDALGLAERVELVAGDGLADVEGPFDLVVSNPPYIPTEQIASLPPEVRHEPREALDGGPDGLDAIRRLIADLPGRLERRAWLALEVGAGQAPAVAELLNSAGAAGVETHADLAGVERVVCARFEED